MPHNKAIFDNFLLRRAVLKEQNGLLGQPHLVNIFHKENHTKVL